MVLEIVSASSRLRRWYSTYILRQGLASVFVKLKSKSDIKRIIDHFKK